MGPGRFFSGLKNIPDILGRTDFDFDNFYLFCFLGPKILAWAHPRGPHVGPPTKWVGPAWAHPLNGWAPRGPTH